MKKNYLCISNRKKRAMSKRIILLVAAISALFVSCGKDGGEAVPQNLIQEEAKIDGRAYDALKNAGIALNELKNLYMSGIWFGEIDSNGNGIHYISVSATKDNTAYIYLLKFVVNGQGSKYNSYDLATVEKFSYVKTYSFPIAEKEIVVDHGYGNKETLTFAGTLVNNFIQSGSNYYAAIHDIYADGELPGITSHEFCHHKLLMDRSGSVKTCPYELVTEDIPTSGISGYNNGLWVGYNSSVICGPYCFSKDGEILFQTSAWSDLYSSNIYYASFGTWYFPISENNMFIVCFRANYSKAEPSYAEVVYTLDDIKTGDAVYLESKAVDSSQNVYSPAKFVSEKDGIYKFTIEAVVYSGDKKTFKITIDRGKQTCVVE